MVTGHLLQLVENILDPTCGRESMLDLHQLLKSFPHLFFTLPSNFSAYSDNISIRFLLISFSCFLTTNSLQAGLHAMFTEMVHQYGGSLVFNFSDTSLENTVLSYLTTSILLDPDAELFLD